MKQQIKLTIAICLAITLMLGGCLKDDVKNLKNRVSDLETQQKDLAALVAALESNDYITDITAVTEAGEQVGYTITFSNSPAITLYNGSVTSINTNANGTVTLTLAGGNKVTLPFEMGDGTAANPRKIFNAEGLNAMRTNLSWHYKLIDDITVSNWLPAGNYINGISSRMFSGSLDGQGYKITINNFSDEIQKSSNGYYNYGLIGYTNSTSHVKNLHVQINVQANSLKTDGIVYYGAIVGNTSGKIENCRVSGTLAFNSSASNAAYIGGIVGSINGSSAVLTNCVSGAAIDAATEGDIFAGALAGQTAYGTLSHSYATGAVNAKGGGCHAGGLVGDVSTNSTITSCVALLESVTGARTGTGTLNVGRVAGDFIISSKVEKNYAYNIMQVNGTPIATGTGTATKHGANCTSANWSLESWWTDTGTYGLGWDNTIWDFSGISTTSYPKLR